MGESVEDAQGVDAAVALAREGVKAPLADAHSEARLVAEASGVAWSLPEATAVLLLLPLPSDGVARPLADALRDNAPLPLGRGDSEGAAVADPGRVGVALALAQLDRLLLPLGGREAAAQEEGCAERVARAETLTETVGVGEAGGDREADVHDVPLPVREAQGEADWLLRKVREARGESDAKPLSDGRAEMETDTVPLPEKEGEFDAAGEGVDDTDMWEEREEVALPVNEGEPQGDGEAEELCDGMGVTEAHAEGLCDSVSDAVPHELPVAVGESLGELQADGVAASETEAGRLSEETPEPLNVTLLQALALGEELAEGKELAKGLTLCNSDEVKHVVEHAL